MLIRPGRPAPPSQLAHPSLFQVPAAPAAATVLARTPVTVPRSAPAPAPALPLPAPPPVWSPRRPVARARRALPFMGPAFVAAIAYVDPGNFATNIGAGAAYGYTLLWVVVTASVVAMLVQYLAAKTGVATGKDVAELCRGTMRRRTRIVLWLQAEVVAMATDLAEFVGAAVALQLLFGLPPLPAGIVTAVAAMALLALRRYGRRPFEAAIVALLLAIALAFGYLLIISGPAPGDVAGGLLPGLAGSGSVLLATGIVGATVMPHAVYVHSAMSAQLGREATTPAARQRLLRGQRTDVFAALGLAATVNVSMMVAAAALLHGKVPGVGDLVEAHTALAVTGGAGAALAFAVALLASGFSSAGVGTCAGDVVMRGFVDIRIRPWLRRLITMLPALALLAWGADTGSALVLSQVVLSFGLPFTLIPLIILTARRSVMGELVNRVRTTVAGAIVTAAIVGLNGVLLVQVLG